METEDFSQGLGFYQPAQPVNQYPLMYQNQQQVVNTPPVMSSIFPSYQAKNTFEADMSSQNLGAGLILGASSFFVNNSQKQQQNQGLFSSQEQDSPSKQPFGASSFTKSKAKPK